MDDSQREAMYDAWKNKQIFVEHHVTVNTPEKIVLEAIYDGVTYKSEFGDHNNHFNLIEKPHYYNQAFNNLLTQLKRVNSKIEMNYLKP